MLHTASSFNNLIIYLSSGLNIATNRNQSQSQLNNVSVRRDVQHHSSDPKFPPRFSEMLHHEAFYNARSA